MNHLNVKGNIAFNESIIMGSLRFSDSDAVSFSIEKDCSKVFLSNSKQEKDSELYEWMKNCQSEYKWGPEEYDSLVKVIAKMVNLCVLRANHVQSNQLNRHWVTSPKQNSKCGNKPKSDFEEWLDFHKG
ncbi:MAG: hypothetical protein LUQ50_11640 [Methanospirillum sp.]|uniref:hypothetical protein n=1 Tax=Methanospirillum sp. TaxID=45200 RepID=UPI002370FCAC|nr:hypothetical protein [Methanospirillum sp.]MDD1729707.1 hypothetical protein [Methanospirillum sp.]